MQSLHLPTFPLHGVRLIEASAGTGKTYAISRLYLRLLLERGLDVREVLVVTFTRAATGELRGRIREVIQEALHALEGEGDTGDEVMASALAHCDRETAKRRLRSALANMDEAAVFTIHGFCQRVLQEHALESGAPFEAVFVESEDDLLRATVEDFWRRTFYPVEAEGLARLADAAYGGPEALKRALAPYLARELEILPIIAPETVAPAAYHAAREAMLSLWREQGAVVRGLLNESPALSRAKDSYKAERLALAYAGLDAFATLAPCDYALPEPDFELFLPATLAAAVSPAKRKKGEEAPSHPFFAACQALQTIRDGRLKRLFREALTACRADLQARKRAQGVLAFDDLIGGLRDALTSERGADLAALLRQRYPVAMIDEFQDTDPAQYAVFSRIYRDAPDGGLFMIGDPKQAIYGFRGGDIHTYLEARHDTRAAGDHYTLDTNWRSAQTLVEAVNHWFEQAQAPFLYPGEIDFHRVRAGGRADRQPLTLDGVRPAPLCLWYVTKTEENAAHGNPKNAIAMDKAKDAIAKAVAGEIVDLLRESSRARLGDAPLRAGDIAVLVRDRFEAWVIRQALRRRELASVFLSQDSVFATAEAAELQALLAAVAEPLDGRLLRIALAGALAGWTAEDLARLDRDESEWERRRLDFLRYRTLCARHGFLGMFYQWLADYSVPARLLAEPGGERRLTDLLHLAELLQAESARQGGLEGLARWLADRRRQPDGRAGDQQTRLESDENLVQIVTIHKSKGLEYPVVFLPFAWGGKPHAGEPPFVFHRAGDRAACLELGSETLATHQALADRERLAEELRLLYVALTRAQHRCYVAYGDIGEARNGAMSYLLCQETRRAFLSVSCPSRGQKRSAAEFLGVGDQGEDMSEPEAEVSLHCAAMDETARRARLDALAASSRGTIAVVDLPAVDAENATASIAEPKVKLTARAFGGRIDDGWRITSYSALTARGRSDAAADYDAEPAPATALPAADDRYGFPRGERAGRLLHELLERLDFPGATVDLLTEEAGRVLRKYGYDEARWQSPLALWMTEVMDAPLDDGGLRLRDLPGARRLNELEFHYSLPAPLRPETLETVLRGLADYREQSPALCFEPARGVMHGYIDLVFEHNGRYYLADYKSNHLGTAAAAYRPEPDLAEAMNAHRYDLQYLLYTLALHRYLRWRLGPRYDYDACFGGVYYLFLRGMSPSEAGAGVYFTRPEHAVIDGLDRALSGCSPDAVAASPRWRTGD
jgi:exodeoxyribonuclease V beta subunit